jgi:hypothetical protein
MGDGTPAETLTKDDEEVEDRPLEGGGVENDRQVIVRQHHNEIKQQDDDASVQGTEDFTFSVELPEEV